MTENIPIDSYEKKLEQRYVVEVWNPKNPDSTSLTIDIIDMSEIDTIAFGNQYGWNYFDAEYYLTRFPNTTTVVVRDVASGKIVGYSIAESAHQIYGNNELYKDRNPSPDTAYIVNTVISEQHRGKHLIEQIMAELETELKHKGYLFIERDAAAYAEEGKESYADQIIKNNPDRIIYTQIHDSPLGPQLFIRMRL